MQFDILIKVAPEERPRGNGSKRSEFQAAKEKPFS